MYLITTSSYKLSANLQKILHVIHNIQENMYSHQSKVLQKKNEEKPSQGKDTSFKEKSFSKSKKEG